MVPAGCALFPQNASLNIGTIRRFEPEFYEEIEKNTKGKLPEKVYFNKGL